MSLSGYYRHSVGYYFTEGNETNGIILELPSAHNHEDRIRIAQENNVKWDYCILLYTDDHKRYFANNILDREIAIGVNKALTEILIFYNSSKTIIKKEAINWTK